MKSIIGLRMVVTLVPAVSAKANPCTADIASAELLFNEQEGQTAGPSLLEIKAAQRHHQRSPASIARAEASSDNSQSIPRAVDALNSAGQVDEAGDAVTCASKLAEMRAILGAH